VPVVEGPRPAKRVLRAAVSPLYRLVERDLEAATDLARALRAAPRPAPVVERVLREFWLAPEINRPDYHPGIL
jgi:hypothetical protein